MRNYKKKYIKYKTKYYYLKNILGGSLKINDPEPQQNITDKSLLLDSIENLPNGPEPQQNITDKFLLLESIGNVPNEFDDLIDALSKIHFKAINILIENSNENELIEYINKNLNIDNYLKELILNNLKILLNKFRLLKEKLSNDNLDIKLEKLKVKESFTIKDFNSTEMENNILNFIIYRNNENERLVREREREREGERNNFRNRNNFGNRGRNSRCEQPW